MTNLVTLKCRNCAIAGIPDGITNLKHLQELCLPCNRFGRNSPWHALRYVAIIDSPVPVAPRVAMLPEALGEVTTLQRLDLSYNPVEVHTQHRPYRPNGDSRGSHTHCTLQMLPSSMSSLTQLTHLNLDSNYPLRHIAEAALQGMGMSLAELHIAYCRQLHEIPSAVVCLTRYV